MSSLDENLTSLDRLLAGLSGSSDRLLLEHLRSARSSFLGSALGEYRMNLQQAQESLGCISDKKVRSDTKQSLQSLIDSSQGGPRNAPPTV